MLLKRSLQMMLLSLLFIPPVFAQERSQLITGSFEKKSFGEFIEILESQTHYHFYYNPSEFNLPPITLNVAGGSLENVLETVFINTDYHFVIDDQHNVFLTKGETINTAFAEESTNNQNKSGKAEGSDEQFENLAAFRERKVYEIGVVSKTQKAEKVNLLGLVTSSPSGSPVTGASIAVLQTSIGTITDDEGRYTLSLPPGRHQLRISSVGLKTTTRNILLHSNGRLNIEMAIEVTNLQELVVTAGRASNVKGLQMGVEKLDMQAIKYIPSSFGEADVLKAVLTLPGVKTIGEASSGFNVRGGAADQNLILYNESTIYNPFHFFGFFSSFGSESIQDVELYKSVIPANYGGRLSSVLKITGRKGDKEKFTGSAGIGLLTSRINIEGPIVKNKTSFAAGARTTYSNWLFSFLPEGSGYRNSKASFHDVNLSLDHTFNSENSLSVYGYLSSDESNLNTDTSYTYSNRNISLQWAHDFNQKLGSTFTVGHDHYHYGNESTVAPPTAYELRFSIDQTNLKADFVYERSPKNTFQFGLSSIYYKLEPGSFLPVGDQSSIAPDVIAPEQGLESALYINGKFDFTPKFSVQAGIRYSFFNYLGPREVNYYAPNVPVNEDNRIDTKMHGSNESIKTYHGPEFRLSSRYIITNNLSIKAGYNTLRQYIHMLSNTVAISPTDIWKLSDPNIKPQFSQQISLGLYKNFSAKWETSVEVYTKRIKNYLDYKSGSVLVMNPSVETEVLTTQGKGYGVELMIKKTAGKFNGWVSYTYSRILLKMDDPNAGERINNGEYYPASYDKPHDLNFTGNQKLSRRVSLSINLNYSTGRPVTIPIGVFSYGGSQKTLYSGRNSYRIPDYFRTDISLNIEGNHKLKQLLHNSWTIGVYNLTGRRNPYSVYFTSENGVVNGYKISIFGSAIPFINYNVRF